MGFAHGHWSSLWDSQVSSWPYSSVSFNLGAFIGVSVMIASIYAREKVLNPVEWALSAIGLLANYLFVDFSSNTYVSCSPPPTLPHFSRCQGRPGARARRGKVVCPLPRTSPASPWCPPPARNTTEAALRCRNWGFFS